jgi:hypothetical protein
MGQRGVRGLSVEWARELSEAAGNGSLQQAFACLVSLPVLYIDACRRQMPLMKTPSLPKSSALNCNEPPLRLWRTMARQGPEDLAAIATKFDSTSLFGYGTVTATCLTSNWHFQLNRTGRTS